MKISDFDFHLPTERIAQTPVERGSSRLLHLTALGAMRHGTIADLPTLVEPGDTVVVNDTRVIPARLYARRRSSGGRVEILLVERTGPREWDALAKPGRKAKRGEILDLDHGTGGPALEVEVIAEGAEGRRRVRFSEPIEPHLDAIGHTPLPPYIRRSDTPHDGERYQTVYAAHPGAVAAPTAGLHFSDDLLRSIEAKGVEIARLTLHVGIGTFRPVQVETVEEHVMESERCEIPCDTADAIRRTRDRGGRILAVGTTVVRTLEGAAARFDGEVPAWSGRTDLFLRPGVRFRVVDRLLTNFHLPRSTLLMLVAAFAGRERVIAAYEEAVAREYRFYSYGDAMLVERSS